MEVCWVMQHWLDKGWDVNYIIDQSLKWHISSFNGKSSAENMADARAYLEHWMGITTASAAVSAFTVRRPSEGGQSRRM